MELRNPSKHVMKSIIDGRKEERAIYLLELSPALGENDDMVIPCGVLEAQLGEDHHRRVDLVHQRGQRR